MGGCGSGDGKIASRQSLKKVPGLLKASIPSRRLHRQQPRHKLTQAAHQARMNACARAKRSASWSRADKENE